jgi:hypothetical protein
MRGFRNVSTPRQGIGQVPGIGGDALEMLVQSRAEDSVAGDAALRVCRCKVFWLCSRPILDFAERVILPSSFLLGNHHGHMHHHSVISARTRGKCRKMIGSPGPGESGMLYAFLLTFRAFELSFLVPHPPPSYALQQNLTLTVRSASLSMLPRPYSQRRNMPSPATT